MMRNSYAKINLGLHILAKRPDGYHELETVFYRIGWHDCIHFLPSSKIEMVCYDATIPTDERNLCMKAALALLPFQKKKAGIKMYLEKEIPHGAGLGGGSGNAATVLQHLNLAWDLKLPIEQLLAIGKQLGADVPFFLKEKPQFATGIGEVLTDLAYQMPFELVVVKPTCSVATAMAFQSIQPNAVQRADIKEVVLSNDLSRWRAELVNDFEATVIPQFPEIAQFKQEFYDCGAEYASMSGSGSAVFGIFTDTQLAHRMHLLHAVRGYPVWSTVIP